MPDGAKCVWVCVSLSVRFTPAYTVRVRTSMCVSTVAAGV